MRVVITGGREFDDAVLFLTVMDTFHAKRNITHLVHGGAIGCDKMSAAWAEMNNIRVSEYKPDYDKYPPKVAPLRRNEVMVDTGPKYVIAFPGKNGTRHTLEYALSKGIKVIDMVDL